MKKTYLKYKNENEGAEPAPDVLKKLIKVALGQSKESQIHFKSYFENFVYRHQEGLRVSREGAIKVKPLRAIAPP